MHGTGNKKWIVRLSVPLIHAATAHASIEVGIDVLPSGGTFICARVGEGESPQRLIADWRTNELKLPRACPIFALLSVA